MSGTPRPACSRAPRTASPASSRSDCGLFANLVIPAPAIRTGSMTPPFPLLSVSLTRGADGEQRLAVLDHGAVLDLHGAHGARGPRLDVVHQLHDLDDADDVLRVDVLPLLDEGRRVGLGRAVEDPDAG